MASLISRLSDAFTRVATEIKAVKLRLPPTGGNKGQTLVKTSASDNAWVWTDRRVGFSFPCSGKPAAGEKLGPYVSDIAFTIPANLTTSISRAGAAATSAAVFTLTKNGTNIGTVTYAAGAVTSTLATATNADVAVVRGDVFFLVCPATQDSTIADIGTTIAGVQ